ncbi:TrbC/VirB2 family protein [Rickettsia endosymbiont of Halotydeus destructor]|uniref:TrbC/VirB2 family protein n=1 Tax=Rickettsia endosymbiont of Halotydeus destructor TaxID=2996754 RepID=UPI003BAFBC8C
MQKRLYPNNIIKSNKSSTTIVKLFAIFVTLFISANVLADRFDDPIGDPIGYRLCILIGTLQYNVTRIIGMIAITGLGVLSLQGSCHGQSL